MLDLYGRVGRALYAVRVLLLAGIVAGAGFFVAALIGENEGLEETRILLPLLACLWFLCMTVFAYGFSGRIPVVEPGMGWWRRTVTRMKRTLWHILALTMTGLGLATVLFTFRALTIIRGELGVP